MKKLLLLTTSFLMFSMASFAQNSIQLNIHHKMENADFEIKEETSNNLGNELDFTLLFYYLSEISIVHDGGTETLIEDLWVLVNAAEATQIDLGEHDITSVEMVKLHVGVDPEHNHLDPASHPASHPLAPKFPSMHWGWDPGYFFVTLAGNGGTDLNQVFELYGLGDPNYFTTEIPLTVEAENNAVIIHVDADYTRALENIDVSAGLIIHSDDGEAAHCVENFRDYVFSEGDGITATVDFSEVNKFEVFPNPTNGFATINLEASKDLNYQVSVTDILGQQVLFFDAVNSNSTIDVQLEKAGFYFVNLIKEGQPVLTKKLISK